MLVVELCYRAACHHHQGPGDFSGLSRWMETKTRKPDKHKCIVNSTLQWFKIEEPDCVRLKPMPQPKKLAFSRGPYPECLKRLSCFALKKPQISNKSFDKVLYSWVDYLITGRNLQTASRQHRLTWITSRTHACYTECAQTDPCVSD